MSRKDRSVRFEEERACLVVDSCNVIYPLCETFTPEYQFMPRDKACRYAKHLAEIHTGRMFRVVSSKQDRAYLTRVQTRQTEFKWNPLSNEWLPIAETPVVKEKP